MTKQKRHYWTEQEINLLRLHYPMMSNRELSPLLNHSPETIQNKAGKLGIVKSPDFYKRTDLWQQREKFLKTQFVKGHDTHNKGKKMPPEVYEKVKSTMFTKGHDNRSLPIGEERAKKHNLLYVKVGQPNRWKLKHHIVYEQHHGVKIPRGCLVIFINGDTRDFRPENLRMLTRAEMADLQNPDKQYPPELAQTIRAVWKLKGALTQQTKKGG